MSELQSVVSKLEEGVDWSRVHAKMVPRWVQFSDSLVFLAPLEVAGHPHYRGLESVAMRCSQVAHVVLDQVI
jgi:hypothetical protein